MVAASFLDEKLSIYPFENGDYSLMEFHYTFEESDKGFKGLYPKQFASLFDNDLEWFTLDLVQGRWNEKFVKHINSFQDI